MAENHMSRLVSQRDRAPRLLRCAAVACATLGLGFTASADIPASAYIQDGLIAQWDGIDNAGTGVHDPESTVWKDLKGSLDMTLTANGSWGSGAYLNVSGCSAKGTSATPSYKTIEIYYRSENSAGRLMFVSGLQNRIAAFPTTGTYIQFDGKASGGIVSNIPVDGAARFVK